MKDGAPTRELYTEYAFGRFNYDRSKYYCDSILTKHARRLCPEDVVYDIGCGQGWVMEYLKGQIPNCIIGLDLSSSAVTYCKSVGLEAYEMDNMNLDLPDGISDFTISNGVIHHTPDPYKSFQELARITKRGGKFYLSVYRRSHFYYYVYTLSKPARLLYQFNKRLALALVFPFYYLFYFLPMFLLLERKIVDRKSAVTLFMDQILTPIAEFFRKSEIEAWAASNRLRVTDYALERKGQMMSFILEKE